MTTYFQYFLMRLQHEYAHSFKIFELSRVRFQVAHLIQTNLTYQACLRNIHSPDGENGVTDKLFFEKLVREVVYAEEYIEEVNLWRRAMTKRYLILILK